MNSARAVSIYGYVSLGILLVLFFLLWTGSLDPSLNFPVLVFAALLILSRMVLRVVVGRRSTTASMDQGSEADR